MNTNSASANGSKNLPSFLVIGVPKSGTTSLHNYFNGHPSLFMPEHKELHYFSAEIIGKNTAGPGDLEAANNGIIKTQAEYEACFSNAEGDACIGEVSPSYFYFAEECTPKIKDLLPDVKLILVLRDPIERAFSNYLHLTREGRESLSFLDGLKAEQQRKQDGYGDFWRYSEHSLYYDKTRFILDQFGKDNVKLVVNEQLKANPDEVVKELFEFIGVDPSISINTATTYNSSAVYSENLVTKLFNGNSSAKAALMKLIPSSAADKLRQIKANKLKKYEMPKPQLEEDAIVYLRDVFKQDVESMAEYIDTSYWKTTLPKS